MSSESHSSGIESILQEQRKFEPAPEFRRAAHIGSLEDYERIYRESVEQPEQFWGRVANELHWFKKWDRVLDWNVPWAKWFVEANSIFPTTASTATCKAHARIRPRLFGKASPAKFAPLLTSNSIAKSRNSPTSSRPGAFTKAIASPFTWV